jgi:DTW domain-containing protein YfiP
MRELCRLCNRPGAYCFCELAAPFASDARFALIVHPDEAQSTIGTAWILRRSISNLIWLRSRGKDLDQNPRFHDLLASTETTPLLLFPGPTALNLSHTPEPLWRNLAPKKPLFFVIDGTWTQAKQMLRKSEILRALPRVSFETTRLSEYHFKKQPRPHCLSCVEGVHRVIELLAERGWASAPGLREHDRMIEIFRRMVGYQVNRQSHQVRRIESRRMG